MERQKGKSVIEFPEAYIVMDVETTGLSTEYDEIIEVAALRVQNGEVVGQFSTLVRPENEISEFVTELTGITNAELSAAEPIETILPDFKDFIGADILVGHNINFDVNFLYDAFCRCSGYIMQNDFVDTMRIARKLLPELEHHRLDDLIRYCGIEERETHRALNDCHKTFDIYRRMRTAAEETFGTIEAFKKAFKRKPAPHLDLTTITPDDGAEFDETHLFYGKTCVFTGKLENLTRKEAAQLVVNVGGNVENSVTKKTNFLVMGGFDYCTSLKDGKSSKRKKAESLILKGADLQILTETDFFDILQAGE